MTSTRTTDFEYTEATRTFIAEVSAIEGNLNTDDGQEMGLTIVGRTGHEVRFTVTDRVLDADNDVKMWRLTSEPLSVFKMILFND